MNFTPEEKNDLRQLFRTALIMFTVIGVTLIAVAVFANVTGLQVDGITTSTLLENTPYPTPLPK